MDTIAKLTRYFELKKAPIVKLDLPYGSGFCCPNCSDTPPDTETYKRKGKEYPVCVNKHIARYSEYEAEEWDEIHYCRKCKIEYYFSNGSH